MIAVPALGDDGASARATTAGLAALVAIFVGVAVVNAVATPAFLPPDEHAHVAYGYAITDAQLPSVFDPQAGGPYEYRDDRTIYTANHPPLYYVAMGPTILGLNQLVAPDTAVRLARLLSVAFGALGVVATAGVLSELVPGRPAVWISGTALVFAVPDLTYRFSHIYNDSLGYATGFAALWAGLRIHNRGSTTPRTVALALAVAAASLTRISAVPFALVGAAIAAVGVWRHAPAGHRTRSLVRLTTIVAVPTLLTAAPFFLRNRRLYGDFTGGEQLFDLIGRVPAPFSTVVDPHRLANTYRNMWITGPDQSGPVITAAAWFSAAFFWCVVALAGYGLVRVLAAWWRGDARDRILPAVACAAVVTAVLAGFAQHVMGGGLPHARYLFGAFFVIGLLAALALDVLPRPVHLAVVGAAVFGSLVASWGRVDRMLVTYWYPDEPSAWSRWIELSRSLGPGPTTIGVVGALVAIVAAGVLLHALARLRSPLSNVADDPGRLRPRP